jgi:biopolymer transport protein ExbD
VLVKADRRVRYESVVEGFLLLKNAGAQKLSVLTDPVETEQG